MTKAKRYKQLYTNFSDAPSMKLDDYWSAKVSSDGGLELFGGISKDKFSEKSTMKLINFLNDCFVKDIKK